MLGTLEQACAEIEDIHLGGGVVVWLNGDTPRCVDAFNMGDEIWESLAIHPSAQSLLF